MKRFFYAAAVVLAASQPAFAERAVYQPDPEPNIAEKTQAWLTAQRPSQVTPAQTAPALPVVLLSPKPAALSVDYADDDAYDQVRRAVRTLTERAYLAQPIFDAMLSKPPRLVVLEHGDTPNTLREYVSASCALENVQCEFFKVGADALMDPGALNIYKSTPAPARRGSKK